MVIACARMKISSFTHAEPVHWGNYSIVKNKLRIFNLNAYSVVNKIEPLELILLGHDPHIAIIVKPAFHDNVSDDSVISGSHKIFRRDCPSRLGGVAAILKKGIDAVILNHIEDHESEGKLLRKHHCLICRV